MDTPISRRPWVRPLVIGLAVFAVMAVAMSYLFLVEWSQVTEARPPEAERAFAEAVLTAGGPPPYLEIRTDGTVQVNRDQEGPTPQRFGTLTLLAWSPSRGKMLRLDYPHWFVRLKTSTSFNLGTMVTLFSKDWEHLDLSVTYHDLKKRGPALLLDHQQQNGARIVLWTSPTGP